jgi:hypothetical protein
VNENHEKDHESDKEHEVIRYIRSGVREITGIKDQGSFIDGCRWNESILIDGSIWEMGD